jgi:hypothetical protein
MPRKVVEDRPDDVRSLQSLFATDLFRCFPNLSGEEVPAVNKPRRACLYVPSTLSVESVENSKYLLRALFSSLAARLRDD